MTESPSCFAEDIISSSWHTNYEQKLKVSFSNWKYWVNVTMEWTQESKSSIWLVGIEWNITFFRVFFSFQEKKSISFGIWCCFQHFLCVDKVLPADSNTTTQMIMLWAHWESINIFFLYFSCRAFAWKWSPNRIM